VSICPAIRFANAAGTLTILDSRPTICNQWGTDAQRRYQSYRQICGQPRAHAAPHARDDPSSARRCTRADIQAGPELREGPRPHRGRPPAAHLPNPSVTVPFFFEDAPASLGWPAAEESADAPSPSFLSDFLATSEGLDLVRAFTCIEDAKLRRVI